MNELVELVMKKTNLSEDVARTAVETVLNYVKQKLPEPLAGQIDSFVNEKGALGGLTKGLENFLGK